MKRAVRLLLALAAAALLPACMGGGTETGNAGVVSGNVHDGGGTETGNTEIFLVSMRLKADGSDSSAVRVTRSDARGAYAFTGVEPGRYAVFAPGSGETPRTAIATRLAVAANRQESVDLTLRQSVTLLGRVLPDSGTSLSDVRVCVPGMASCVEPSADSTYRIPYAPVGAYELIAVSSGRTQYLAIQVSADAAGIIHLRDLALTGAESADHRPYRFYDLGRPVSLSSLPLRYAANAAPAWYSGKRFDLVEYFLLSESGAPQAWNADWFQAWPYRRAVTGETLAGGPDLTGPVSGLPVPVRLAAPDFDFSQAESDGSDLVVSDGNGRLLAHAIERWDAAAGKAEIWVRMDTLAARKADRRLMLHWGRKVAPLPSHGPVFRSGDGFLGAWHFAETGGDTSAADASSLFASRVRGPQAPGGIRGLEAVVGRGYRFGTTRNYVHVPHAPGLDVSESFTVAVWARLDSATPAVKQLLASKWEPNQREWHFHIHSNRSLEIEFGDNLGAILGAWRSVDPIANLDGWRHYAATFDRGTVRLFVDGVEVAGILAPDVPGFRNGAIPASINRFQADLNIASNTIDTSLNLGGDLDEFWYVGEAKSAEWIRMAYESQRPR